MKYTEEERLKIFDLHIKEKLSYGQIAKKFHPPVTRGSIAGVVFRFRNSNPLLSDVRKTCSARPEFDSDRRAKPSLLSISLPAEEPEAEAPPPLKAPRPVSPDSSRPDARELLRQAQVEPETEEVDVIDWIVGLTSRKCRWIEGEPSTGRVIACKGHTTQNVILRAGYAAQDTSYCPHHQLKAFSRGKTYRNAD